MTSLKGVSSEQYEDLVQMSTGQPPPGIVPNFVDRMDRTGQVFATGPPLLALMILFALNRFFKSIWITRKRAWDDLTIGIGFVFQTFLDRGIVEC